MTLKDNIQRQLDLEDEARGLGQVRYRQSRPMPWRSPEDDITVDEEANLPPGQHLIRTAVEPTAALLRDKIKAAQSGKAGARFSALGWLEMSKPEEISYLAARVAMNAATSNMTFQKAALTLASYIIEHVRMLDFKKTNAAGYVGLIRKNHGRRRGSAKRREAIRKLLDKENSAEMDDFRAITRSSRVHLGSFMLDTLIEATGFFTLEAGISNRGSEGYFLRPTEAIQKWLEEQHARCELLDPVMMPMVVRPRRWRTPWVGGYLRPMVGMNDKLVRARSASYQRTLYDTDLSLVYEAVNYIQETPWRINRTVLDVMRQVWDGGGQLGGLPLRSDIPLPEYPETEDPDAIKEWKREAAIIHAENSQLQSKRLAAQQRLWIAEKFADEEAIFFPHYLDFRGRIYPMAAIGVHPQADDGGKALLEFAQGHPLGPNGGYWLAVHIANLFGVDKVSFTERVEWTYAHSAQIIDSATNPLDGDRFWATADDPWMALAAAAEFVGFLQEGEDFVSHLPIPLDGSNSGLQHFSAMLRDPVGASAVNLLPSEDPQDVYQAVADAAQAVVDADDDPEAAPWKGGKVSRKVAKRPTMTFVYSATRFGMHDMILQALAEIDAENERRGLPPYLGDANPHSAARYLSHVMFDAISNVVSAASGAMSWLRETAKVVAGAGLPVSWTTPDGLPVMQAYRTQYGQRVKVHWQGSVIKVTLATEGETLNQRSQANGIAPNFVHSLDAAHLRAVARAASRAGIPALAVIHDSFGTHAAFTDKLSELLRETFVEQYTPDVLENFRSEIIDQLDDDDKERIAPIPDKGTLNLRDVLQSRYAFA